MHTLAKWSVDDYHHMIDAGILHDRRVELLAGDIIEMTPEKPIHYSRARRTSQYLAILLQGLADVRFNGPITLANSEPEPDVAIVQISDIGYEDRHPGAEDIFWLIEVANSSLQTDLTLKAALYAQAAIPEYWVIDLADRRLHLLRQPQGDRYQQQTILTTGTLIPLAFPEITIEVDRLLNRL
ncbi:Uma2 family endonuclease [Alkalinema sp. FACHB-956]|uniref:Uma2 family endonuclease n=1 Tax=Alkalinema sp. FACHB-956 TaxID=2692768 RepID=UPI001687FB0C|nr:Uma2 family endonuclease [Alkalinema sp. FACHB-956]MBD2327511.1 Uma2 family endonuclease [Alkalinema sp. FACHB-956]